MPVRSCKGCRQRHESHALLRLVVVDGCVQATPARAPRPDAPQRTPDASERPRRADDKQGRGMYMCPSFACAQIALRGGRRSGSPVGDPVEVLRRARQTASVLLTQRSEGMRRRRLDVDADAQIVAMRSLLERLQKAESDATCPQRGRRETRP